MFLAFPDKINVIQMMQQILFQLPQSHHRLQFFKRHIEIRFFLFHYIVFRNQHQIIAPIIRLSVTHQPFRHPQFGIPDTFVDKITVDKIKLISRTGSLQYLIKLLFGSRSKLILSFFQLDLGNLH